MPDLDDRIRALVASAVADAPTAPELEQIQLQPQVARKRPSWPKWTAALAALLAAGGATVALQPANEGDVDTRPDTTATTQFLPRHEPSVIVTAGPDGIRENVDGTERVVSRDRMLAAFPLDNGDVIAIRSLTYTGKPSDNPPVRIAADGTITPVFENAPPSGFITIHDFSVVDGKRVLLYSLHLNTTSVDSAKRTLYAMDPDTKAVTEIGDVGDSFSTTNGLALGSNGLIVGTKANHQGGNTWGLFVAALPGSEAAAHPLPKPRDYGLDETYDEGCDCPTNYFTDATGTSLFWVSTRPDATGTAVYSARIAERGKSPTMLKALPDHGATVAETFPEISARGIVVNYADVGDGPLHGPVLLQGDSVVDLGGHYASVGPNG